MTKNCFGPQDRIFLFRISLPSFRQGRSFIASRVNQHIAEELGVAQAPGLDLHIRQMEGDFSVTSLYKLVDT